MLSSFAYHSCITHLKSRASKKGVAIGEVNPAYTPSTWKAPIRIELKVPAIELFLKGLY